MSLITLQSLSSHPSFNPSVSSGPLLPEVAHRVGIEAWEYRGEPGALKALADQYDVSRQTVRGLGCEVEAAWQDFEVHGGRAAPAHVVVVDRPRLLRATVGLRAETPASLRGIQKAHEHFYDLSVSYGSVQSIVTEAEDRASDLLSEVPLNGIEWISLDELFIQGTPILVGVDLDTSYLFCIRTSRSRDKHAWKEALEPAKAQGLAPIGMVSDDGKGLKAGAQLAFGDLLLHGDLFHGKYECLKVLTHLERRGYAAIEAAEKAERRRMNPRPGDDRLSLGQRARRADEHAIRAMYVHDRTLEITREVFEMMELVELRTGAFRDAEQAAARIIELSGELRGLRHRRCDKLATWLKNQARALCAWLSHVALALDEITNDSTEAPAVRILAWLWRLDHEMSLPCNRYRLAELKRLRNQAIETLEALQLPEGRLEQLLVRTAEVIEHRHRASSLVECLNSLLRPWLEAHKRVTQGALDLFAARWNLYVRKHGKLAGSSPHNALTGRRIRDWLSALGYPIVVASR